MNNRLFRGAAMLASTAALSLAATPALARDPWGGWGGGRWGGGGWGGGWGHHHDGVDAGDIFAGILIIGGIAAIASAASKANKDRRVDDRRYPDNRDYRGDDYRGESRDAPGRDGYGAAYNGDMNDAVNRCIDEINRGRSRVDSVDGAERDGSGWRVRGRVNNNGQFSCAIDGDGRIRNVSIDGHAA
ncbi:MAG: hypothetical protein KGM18_13260 [Sphingomonadales bacterium]|nr:hypothetical protein [Sphingomonadales bacterium]